MDEDFSEILREYLLEERQKNPAINETTIAKKMGIPPTTFNRLLNGYSKKASVSTIIKLSQFIPKLKKNLPENIVKMFEVTMEKKTAQYMGQVMETLLADKHLFICWALVHSKKGITKDEIREDFGMQGLLALEILEKKNIILKDTTGRYKVKEQNKCITLSLHLIKAHLLFLAEEYKPDNLKINYIHYRIKHLNEEGRKKIMQAHQELHKKIYRIMDDKENQGNISYFSIGCSDILSRKN